jgi:tetratricopeptide (TPR) repeat protein
MRRVLRVAVIAWLTLLVAASAGLAQTSRERAEALNEEGRALFQTGDFAEAAKRFEAAIQLAPASKYVYNLAYAYNSAAESEKAKAAFLRYLELCRAETAGQCSDEARVQQEIERLDDILFKSLPKVFIDSTPQAANVFLLSQGQEERLVGQTPLTLRLAEGKYELRIEKEAHETLSHTFEVQRIGDLRLAFPLTKLRNLGNLQISVNVRGARIYVDGNVHGLSPRERPLEVPAGPRQVIVEKDGYGRLEKEVTVVSGQTTQVDFDLALRDSPATWRSYVGWPTASVGLLGIGTGILFWQLADQEFTGTPKFNDYELYQNIGYGLGGGLLAVGMGLLIWEWADPVTVESGEELANRPWLPVFAPNADGGASLGVVGRF